jgi:hypothetical protein
MDELTRWLAQQRADRLVEDNSAFGRAIPYRQDHWDTLRRFVPLAGAPLDNHVAERRVKLCIGQRKNSFCYTSEHRASLARVLTRLIATCLSAGVKALEDWVALPEHRAEGCAAPAAWVPWT